VFTQTYEEIYRPDLDSAPWLRRVALSGGALMREPIPLKPIWNGIYRVKVFAEYVVNNGDVVEVHDHYQFVQVFYAHDGVLIPIVEPRSVSSLSALKSDLDLWLVRFFAGNLSEAARNVHYFCRSFKWGGLGARLTREQAG
jgi:hypothetical protein